MYRLQLVELKSAQNDRWVWMDAKSFMILFITRIHSAAAYFPLVVVSARECEAEEWEEEYALLGLLLVHVNSFYDWNRFFNRGEPRTHLAVYSSINPHPPLDMTEKTGSKQTDNWQEERVELFICGRTIDGLLGFAVSCCSSSYRTQSGARRFSGSFWRFRLAFFVCCRSFLLNV